MTGTNDYLRHHVTRQQRDDGTVILGSGLDLGPVARCSGEWLHRWAEESPDRVFLAERSGAGWRKATYGEMLEQVRAVAAALLERGFGPGRTIVALSGPGIDHAILTLAAQYVGAPIVPLAEQYSLITEAHSRLLYAVNKVRPAMIYASDGDRFAAALALPELAGIEQLVSRGAGPNQTRFESLLSGRAGPDVDAAHAAVGPDTMAKILFTSGSTSMPKGVPQTQRMMCVNQAQYLACLPMLGARPPVMVDWLPWNHVFASSSNFNMILSNGGTLYLDDGKPVKALFERTLENLAMQGATLSCNVPIAYALLIAAMRDNADLRRTFFADLDLIFYAGASLPQDVWTALEDMALEETGRVPMMTSSWGMTETAPAAILHYQGGASTGMIGVPLPELETKLVPDQPGRYELRVRGPNIMPEYFEDAERTAESFDEEGFFVTGDAVRFADPDDITRGVRFDGRVAEDFKLMTGIWVHASALRLAALATLGGLVQDVVVTGDGRADLGLLIFPNPARVQAGAGQAVIDDTDYCAEIVTRLRDLASHATGSSSRIVRALVLAEPPSVGDGEITAKGSLNNRAVLSRRAGLLERLYDDGDAAVLLI
ncbi:MAG: feruloyl-CoA synthase [Jhaorihella sp.]